MTCTGIGNTGGRGNTVRGRKEILSSILKCYVEEPVGCPGRDVQEKPELEMEI